MSVDATALYRERGLAKQQAQILRPALVIVDFSYGFTDPNSDLFCDVEDAITKTADLLKTARNSMVPRVFTRIEYDCGTKQIAAPFLEKMPALADCVVGSRWSQIDDRIRPESGEPILSKLFASGFFGTSLASFLAAHNCDGVVVVGASTSGCVRATVVDAMQHGYRVVVPRSAVADRAVEPHEAALFDIDAKYGQVTSLDQAQSLLSTADRRKVQK